jgi:hypothetical protein
MNNAIYRDFYRRMSARTRDGDRAASKYRDARRMNPKGRKHILARAASRYSFDPRFESSLVDEATNEAGRGLKRGWQHGVYSTEPCDGNPMFDGGKKLN